MRIVEDYHFGRKMKVYEDRPRNLTDMLRRTLVRCPDKEALVMNNRRLTYRDTWEELKKIAGNLQVFYGIQKGDRIALLLGNSIEFALLVFACARIGAIVVTLNTRLQESELQYMLNHSGARLLIFDEEFIEKVEKMRDVENGSNIEQYFLIGKAKTKRKDYLPFEILEKSSLPIEVEVFEDDPLFIMYTSGTTGLPKGAIGSHLGVIHSAMNYQMILKTSSVTKTLLTIPMFHVTGLIGQLLHMVQVGGTSVIMRRYKTPEYLQLLSEEKITFLFNVPTIYTMMMSHQDFSKYRYHSVNCIAYGGAPISQDTINMLHSAFPGAYLHNAYGATETSSPATIMPRDYSDDKLESVGKSVPVGDVRILNEMGEDCKTGEAGQLLIKGPMVIEGYWRDEEANKRSFIDGYWYSGDIAKMDEDGFIYIMDRMKDMINRAGEKIYSVEVENVLYNHDQILEASVIGIPDKIFGEVAKAFIVPKANSQLDSEEIKQFVRERLADYKVPAEIEFITELPRNPGGKVMKTVLKRV